ncbi:MAG: C4-dicarboxylate transporter, DctQ subunit [Desulfuromonadales bacterium]|jgi:TRAP-type C4-dicarboxylate transport system permease small subunit|nr:C4-dicarboxylate transporter, DctQ subunit [Desulfuromonadales bacterium]
MNRKILEKFDRLLGGIEDWALFLSVILALLVALTNVALRKLTPVSLYWSDEVVRKAIFFSAFIGCSAAVRRRALIRIDAMPQMLPVLKKPLTLLNHLAVLVFAGIMIRLGWKFTLVAFRDPFARTSTLQIPEWWFYAVLPTMGALLVVHTLLVMIEDWTGRRDGADDTAADQGQA